MDDTDPHAAAGKGLWHVTVSLDGFGAEPGHETDWMSGVTFRPGLVSEYVESTDAMLTGRSGWDAIGKDAAHTPVIMAP